MSSTTCDAMFKLLRAQARAQRRPLALTPALMPSPVAWPEAESGPVTLRHRVAVGETPIVGVRQAIMRGVRPVIATVIQPRRVHELAEEGYGVWMTDLPEELFQIAEMLATIKPFGRVLVGGLGLGLVASLLRTFRQVTHVTVVERSPHVAKLCPVPKVEIVVADVHQAVGQLPRFDFYLLDTWQGTSEGTWWGEVLPLRRAVRRRFGRRPVIHCWAEDIMLGQVLPKLVTDYPAWYYKALPTMTEAGARAFVKQAGLPAWEKRYGAIVDNLKER